MEDFSTFCKNQPSLLSRIWTSSKNKTKWLNRDRFWNLLFWFGMSFGFSTAFALKGLPELAWTALLLTVIVVPLTVFFFTHTSFVKDSIFLTKEGREIDVKKDLPTRFPIVVTTVALTVLTGTMLDKIGDAIPSIVATTILINVFFLIPTLFFVFKNCPIAILFNRKLWSYIATNAPRSNLSTSRNIIDYSQSTRGSSKQYDDYRYNPSYSAYSSNIYHRNK